MTESQPEIEALANRIRAEADTASRPGQYDRLNQIALDLESVIFPPGQDGGGLS